MASGLHARELLELVGVSGSGTAARPRVSVVVPFHGPSEAAAATFGRLELLRTLPGDEVILVDNNEHGVATAAEGPDVTVVRAAGQQSSYYARNVGAEHASNEWVLFMDSDCRPAESLLDDYFREPVDERCAILAGGVVGASDQRALVARYARSRGHLDEAFHIERKPYPAGITANLMVRRAAWDSMGGFAEGVRSGADLVFCWRAQEAGWCLVHRPEARVVHLHVQTVGALIRKTARHAAGRLWTNRAYPGAFSRPRVVVPLLRCAAGAFAWAARARLDQATFKLLDALWTVADAYGYAFGDNRATVSVGWRGGNASVLAIADAFPARSETFVYNQVRALRASGIDVRVESSTRPTWAELSVAREIPVAYAADDPPSGKLRSLTWLIARHPLRSARDLTWRRRWRPEEPVWPLAALAPAARRAHRLGVRHIHAYFASVGALNAMRIALLLDLPFSVSAYAYDVYQHPRNLPAKLERATFAVADSEYTAAHLRSLVPGRTASRIHALLPGVDPEEFRRQRPYPNGGRALVVSRLVEKKGIPTLIDAAAQLVKSGWRGHVTIVGEGPLRSMLAERIDRLGLRERVVIVREWGAVDVRRRLGEADLFVMPCVIAHDGDRDSLPVAVVEALAMELPVVASNVVGLPEVVRPPWGKLVAPGDPDELAAAMAEVLSLPGEERAAMGAAGRRFVLEHLTRTGQASKFATLLAASGVAPHSRSPGSDEESSVPNPTPDYGEDLDQVVEEEVRTQE